MKKKVIRIGLSILFVATFLTGCQNPPEKVEINKMCVKGSVSRQTHEIIEIGNYQGINLVRVSHKDGSICDSEIHKMWFKYHIKTGEIESQPYQYDIDHLVSSGFCKK